jgi:O-antigen biosynthesis protein WbqP
LKRVLDLLLAAAGGLILTPVALIVAALIVWEDGAPAIFVQKRVGRHGLQFFCYKFRTMKTNTGDHASHQVPVSNITAFGKVARKFKLDELPQIINVLRGDMSFVGPRPCLPSQIELIELRRKAGVLDVMPGITGLAQIRGIDMSDPEALVACEAEYLHRKSFSLDMRILFATFLGKGLRSDAAQNNRGSL